MPQDARADKLAAEKALIAAQTRAESLEGSVSTRAMELEQSRCAFVAWEAAELVSVYKSDFDVVNKGNWQQLAGEPCCRQKSREPDGQSYCPDDDWKVTCCIPVSALLLLARVKSRRPGLVKGGSSRPPQVTMLPAPAGTTTRPCVSAKTRTCAALSAHCSSSWRTQGRGMRTWGSVSSSWLLSRWERQPTALFHAGFAQ